VGDIEEWISAASDLLENKARVEMVTGNVLRRLEEFFQLQTTWSAVTELAHLLLAEGAVEGDRLQAILQQSVQRSGAD
jgi:hypothetical protein